MADDVYRQRKKITREELEGSIAPTGARKINREELEGSENPDPLAGVRRLQEAMAKETGRDVPEPISKADLPFEISGAMPPELREAIAKRGKPQMAGSDSPERPTPRPRPTPDSQVRMAGTDLFESALQRLADQHQWETFDFPSMGKFYSNIPSQVHVRPMTGEEEQILATPRFVKRGEAIDMIFSRCIRETIPTEEMLSVDRTHLLIYLRGISYTPEYDVEVKCPECSIKFQTVIDLNSLDVVQCPQHFGPESLSGVLPASKFQYRYRLSKGQDEQKIAQYREKKIQDWGDQSEDDTLLYRTAMLLEELEGVKMTKEIHFLLKKLPIVDVAHLRNEINQPPFGVKTEISLLCPACTEGFKIDLPLETSFFFPKKKEKEE